ncbi:MAG: hypothetical protein Q8S42_32755 [Archangium sp.]|nr:hypothetical protein [Archangium sp.]
MKRLALLISLSLIAACEPPAEQCSAATCSTGCCDAAGVCQAGVFPQECGMSGLACRACASGTLCQFGQCVGGGSTGGGTGGGGGTCNPRSCVTQGKTCGEIDDGCGGLLMCGLCEVPGESCGAGGVANVCAMGSCVPKTCTSLGRTCGSVSDGCSAQLNCGTCGGSQVCGSAGTCEQSTCTPTTCQAQGKNCGMISDGCNGQLSCGACMVSGQTCGGSGTVNVCGQGACTPRTCTQVGATCGTISDGCGNMISCGSCTGPQTCGGAGTPNTCGAPCIGSCPTGFTCMAGDGACAGGALDNIAFDVPVPVQHTVSGRITRNGVAPSSANCTSGYPYGTLEFVHATDTRFNVSVSLECSGTTTFNFSLPLYPGTYRVTEQPTSYVSMTNLPTWSTVVSTAFTVSAPQSNVAFDVSVPVQITVSGRITRNGVAPSSANCTSGYPYGTLEFVHATDTRFNTSVSLECRGATTFNFSLPLYPGTYRVTEQPTSYVSMTNLPTWSTVVVNALRIQ